MGYFYKALLVFVCFEICCSILKAQVPYDDEVCPDKTRREIKNEEVKKKLANGFSKSLTIISYANYGDRTVDRPLRGPDEFEPYRGKVIRDIVIHIIEPFGASIDKPGEEHYTKFQKFANRIQVKTKDWVVNNDLLFKKGESVNPMLFADTERNLWERGTFKDLKIFVIPVDDSPDLVDVFVIVQDRWSWSLYSGVQYNKMIGGIQFKNLMGLPQSISNYVSLNYRRDDIYTLNGNYSYQNINRTHVDAAISYEYDALTKGGELDIERNFFSAKPDWAGHAMGGYFHQTASLPNALGAAIPTNVTVDWQDLWLARSFKVPGDLGNKYDLLRMVVSGRFYRNQFLDRPYLVSPDGTQLFYNHTYFLGSFGLANWDYYIDHSVYYLDQAEYFSKGFNPAIIMGYDYDEQMNKRFYSGVQLDYGHYIKRLGYFDTRFSYGGYMNGKVYDQVLFHATETFYSAEVKLGRKFALRQFITGNFNVEFDSPEDQALAINNANGLRGIFVNYIRGMRSYTFNFETDVYSKFKVLGFSSSLFCFADLAISQQNSFNSFQLNSGYGGGMRVRLLSLGLDYFEISFAYYPKLNIPGLKNYAIIGGTSNSRALTQNNLFVPNLLSDNSQDYTFSP